jgi:hypothetical protein
MREIVGSLGRIVGAAATARASVSMPRGSLGGKKGETARGVIGEGSLPVKEAAKERGGEKGGGRRGEGEGREERAGSGRSSVNNAATGYANTPTRHASLSSPVLHASRNDQGAMTLSPGQRQGSTADATAHAHACAHALPDGGAGVSGDPPPLALNQEGPRANSSSFASRMAGLARAMGGGGAEGGDGVGEAGGGVSVTNSNGGEGRGLSYVSPSLVPVARPGLFMSMSVCAFACVKPVCVFVCRCRVCLSV